MSQSTRAPQLFAVPSAVEYPPTAVSPIDRTPAAARPLFLWLLLLIIPIAVFQPVLLHGFVDRDDGRMVTGNPYLHPVSWPHVLHFWRYAYFAQYAPLTYTCYALLAWVSELGKPGAAAFDPRVFHLANLVLHLCSTFVVFALVRRLVRSDIGAFCGALLFSVHPLQVEPVAWIGSMDTDLAGLFVLLSLYQYVRLCEADREGRGRESRMRFAFASLFFVLALLAKPAAAALPEIVLALECSVIRRPVRRYLRGIASWAVLSAVWICLTYSAQSDSMVSHVPLWDRPLIAADALAFYIGRLILPLRLAVDYGRTPEAVLSHAWGHWTWLAPAACAVFISCFRKRFPWLLPAGLLFAAALLPVLGLAPFPYQRISTVADHYAYLALLGPSIALAGLLAPPLRPVAVISAMLLLALFCLKSVLQVNTWRDTATLFSQSLTVNPRSLNIRYGLANAYMKEGLWADAAAQYRVIVRLRPFDAGEHCNLALALASMGRLDEAQREYQAALRVDPESGDGYLGLAGVAMREGRTDAAIHDWTESARLSPDYAPTRYYLGMALERRGDMRGAEQQMRIALRLEPDLEPANLALARMDRLQPPAARRGAQPGRSARITRPNSR